MMGDSTNSVQYILPEQMDINIIPCDNDACIH
jgi:hypothetical protein